MLQNHLKYNPKPPRTSTGKERDSETGFSYFGARYYDSDILTGWLSVDPMADKYPNISPYAYCGWNPVRLVDPDGKEYGKTYHEITGELIHDDNENDGKVYIGTKSDGSDRRYIAQENDIADMSVPFDKQLSETKYFFEQCSKELDNEYFSSTNTYVVERFKRFHSLVTDGAKFDLKKTSNYSQKDFSRGKGYSFYHGKLFRYDDYGNYNYGVAAKYYGLLKITALLGAGVNQIKKAVAGVTGWFPSNFKGFGDDPRDTYMIEQGYKHKFDLE